MTIEDRWAWVVLATSFMAICLNGSLNYTVGVLHINLLEAYPDEDPTTIAWVGSLFSALFSVGGFMASIVINVFNVRVCVMLSAVLTLLGFGLSCFVTDIGYLFLTYGLIAGSGQALCFNGSMIVLGYYFKGKSSMASGIASSGTGLSVILFPILTQYLVETYTLRYAFLLLGAVGFQSAVCGALMKPTVYDDFSMQRIVQNTCAKRRISEENRSEKTDWRQNLRLFKNPQFCLVLLSSVSFCAGLSSVYLYLPKYFKTRGSSAREASFVLSFVGLSGFFSRILLGFMGMIVDPVLVFAGIFGITGTITLFINYMTSFGGKIAYALMFGTYTGGCWTLHHTMILQTFGLTKFSTIYGVAMTMGGIGYLTGPPLISLMVQSGRDEYYVFVCAALLFFLASATALSIKLLTPPTLNDVDVELEEVSEKMLNEKEAFIPGDCSEQIVE